MTVLSHSFLRWQLGVGTRDNSDANSDRLSFCLYHTMLTIFRTNWPEDLTEKQDDLYERADALESVVRDDTLGFEAVGWMNDVSNKCATFWTARMTVWLVDTWSRLLLCSTDALFQEMAEYFESVLLDLGYTGLWRTPDLKGHIQAMKEMAQVKIDPGRRGYNPHSLEVEMRRAQEHWVQRWEEVRSLVPGGSTHHGGIVAVEDSATTRPTEPERPLFLADPNILPDDDEVGRIPPATSTFSQLEESSGDAFDELAVEMAALEEHDRTHDRAQLDLLVEAARLEQERCALVAERERGKEARREARRAKAQQN